MQTIEGGEAIACVSDHSFFCWIPESQEFPDCVGFFYGIHGSRSLGFSIVCWLHLGFFCPVGGEIQDDAKKNKDESIIFPERLRDSGTIRKSLGNHTDEKQSVEVQALANHETANHRWGFSRFFCRLCI